MKGSLHNNCDKPLSEASNKEIDSSIVWYELHIREWPEKFGRPAPIKFRDNLAILKAERANRFKK